MIECWYAQLAQNPAWSCCCGLVAGEPIIILANAIIAWAWSWMVIETIANNGYWNYNNPIIHLKWKRP